MSTRSRASECGYRTVLHGETGMEERSTDQQYDRLGLRSTGSANAVARATLYNHAQGQVGNAPVVLENENSTVKSTDDTNILFPRNPGETRVRQDNEESEWTMLDGQTASMASGKRLRRVIRAVRELDLTCVDCPLRLSGRGGDIWCALGKRRDAERARRQACSTRLPSSQDLVNERLGQHLYVAHSDVGGYLQGNVLRLTRTIVLSSIEQKLDARKSVYRRPTHSSPSKDKNSYCRIRFILKESFSIQPPDVTQIPSNFPLESTFMRRARYLIRENTVLMTLLGSQFRRPLRRRRGKSPTLNKGGRDCGQALSRLLGQVCKDIAQRLPSSTRPLSKIDIYLAWALAGGA
ncbi:hypothetical protein C8R47DRAFT_1067790 [Mycena vitilis]|nr:hypothetical protein C8R47DRAFT_1067790 [Mycena vitilis]